RCRRAPKRGLRWPPRAAAPAHPTQSAGIRTSLGGSSSHPMLPSLTLRILVVRSVIYLRLLTHCSRPPPTEARLKKFWTLPFSYTVDASYRGEPAGVCLRLPAPFY